MSEGFPPPVATTIDWLRRSYADWYRDHPPAMPDRFTRREFGYIYWPDRPGPPPFVRHRAYPNAQAFHYDLSRRGPHSVYYSTAYYRKPGELKMAEKQWLGAELIFDLDADHLQEAEKAKAEGHEMTVQDQLALVKNQFKRLLDEFLFGDLGLDEKDVWITFSGGRGYHAHVVDSRYLGLDSKARREIVDYVTGKVPAERGSDVPDLSTFVWEEAVGVDGRGKFAKALRRERTHAVDAPGWQGRMTRALVQVLQEQVLDQEPAQARQWLLSLDGVGPKGAADFVDAFDAGKLERIAAGYLEQGKVVKRVCHHVLQQQTLPMAKGETDEPVTADVKRLIRLPGSLHGKSGLEVVTLTRETLDGFDPFVDAVAFPMDPITFTARNDAAITLGEEHVRVEAGVETEVPMAHAVWWCARQNGTVRP